MFFMKALNDAVNFPMVLGNFGESVVPRLLLQSEDELATNDNYSNLFADMDRRIQLVFVD